MKHTEKKKPIQQMQIRCMQTSQLITTLTQTCKTTSQIHQLHAQTITRGLFSLHPTFLLSHILHSFTHSHTTNTHTPSNSAIIDYLTKIFNLIPNPSSFNYNAIIRAHTLLCFPRTALSLYARMRRRSVSPDFHTFPFVLKACGLSKNSISLAKCLHSEVLKFGFSVDVFACNALACAYCRGGDVGGAEKVFGESMFRDVVSYNVMIDGFVKVGEIDKARELFDEMPERDAVSWGTLLAGYAKQNRCIEAIELFDRMVDSSVRFDNVALVSVLSACAQLGELEKGKKIHNCLSKGVKLDSYLGTALVDLYAKCGCIETAREVFQSCHQKNVSLWNAMLVGLAMNGHGIETLQYFSKMVENGVKPDGVTILGVLVGCSHSGLIDEAKRVFSEMQSVYSVPRELKHYGCMADLLARAGLINDAMEMIDEMPMRGDVFVWGGLLGGCKIHGNLEVAEEAAMRVMQVKPEDDGVYSALAHMYANSHRWDDLVKVRRLRDCRWGIKKSAGCSLIEMGGIRHEFVSGDCLHPKTEEVYGVLNGLEMHGYEVV